MATNITSANSSQELHLIISLPREIDSFRDLNSLAEGLNEIDRLLRKLAPEAWLFHPRRVERRAFLLRFQIGSKPVVEVLTNPAWLTLFLATLVSYKPAKENIKEMVSDASGLLSQIEGLSRDQIGVLKIGIQLMLEGALQTSEQASLKIAKKLHQARARLMGRDGGKVTIVVKEMK